MAQRLLGKTDEQPGTRNRDNPRDFNAYAAILAGKGYNVIRLPHREPAKMAIPTSPTTIA